MIRSGLLVGVGILSAGIILVFSLFRFPQKSFGQISSPKEEYRLPYPGILPDHPFYFLKMIRDRLWVWLTTDPEQRARLYLLLADKRLAAGERLLAKNKPDLALTVVSKGEKYLEKAAFLVKRKKIVSLKERLIKAAQKHQQVLQFEEERIPEEKKEEWRQLRVYPQRVFQWLW